MKPALHRPTKQGRIPKSLTSRSNLIFYIMKSLFYFTLLIAIIAVKPFTVFGQDAEEQKNIIYTTLDVKQSYEIITIIQAPEDITTTAIGGPVIKALNRAWKEFDKIAKSLDADAVVGVRIEIENMSGSIVGRLLIYGTAVKFKDE